MLPWVRPGQLLLTTGYAWPREEDAQRSIVRTLAERNLAGIGLAVPHFFEHFSEAACEEANRVELPLLEIPWEVPFAHITEDVHRTILAEQYRVIEHSEAIHRALTRAALEAGSLQNLATTLSRLIERTIAFTNEDGHVLAVHALEQATQGSALERGEALPAFVAHLKNRGSLRTLHTRSEPLRIPAVPELGFVACILCPIRLQEELVGLVWIIDVLDPAFAPGTGTPEVAGLTNRELLPAIRRLCHETPVVGMEVVEVAPLLDHSAITTMNARKAIFEALTGFAMRKKGIIEPNYMDPVASGKVPFPNLPRTLSL